MSFIFHVLNRVQGSCQWKTWGENNILVTRSVFSTLSRQHVHQIVLQGKKKENVISKNYYRHYTCFSSNIDFRSVFPLTGRIRATQEMDNLFPAI